MKFEHVKLDTPLQRVLARLEGVKPTASGHIAKCRGHDDHTPSLSVNEGADGRVLLKCHAGCSVERIVEVCGLNMADLFSTPFGQPPAGGEGGVSPRRNDSHTRMGRVGACTATSGLTLTQYAAAKRLPEESLRQVGLEDITYRGVPAIRIPYRDQTGAEVAVRFRVRLEKGPEGEDRFKWRTGSHPLPYGMWRLDRARAAGFVVLVEGESDAHTLWLHDVPALGIPGASTWRQEWTALLDGISIVYAVVEPDTGGDTLRAKLLASPLRARLRLVTLGEAKDPSGLYLTDPEGFRSLWATALRDAVAAEDVEVAEQTVRGRAAWEQCASLARAPRILDVLVQDLAQLGVVGEERAAKLIHLVVTSRLLERPVSLALKGPSAAGKSYTTECVLRFFPPSAYFALTAMSEHALAYSEEPLAHRILVLYEAAGLQGDVASYLVRSLLSEGCVRYQTVEKTTEGLRARLIERPGPTGLIVTTTAVHLHPENETRLLSVPVDDTREQTQRVLRSLGNGHHRGAANLAAWHALQTWLEAAERRVAIPFSEVLTNRIPPVAVRLRRDVGLLLTLIRTHGLLHQASRERDAEGRIVATLEDYAVVRELVADLISDGIQVTVSAAVRETVDSVAKLATSEPREVSVNALAASLGLDHSAAFRRAKAALDAGYLVNREEWSCPGRVDT